MSERKPIPVTIIRPYMGWEEIGVKFGASLITAALMAWFVMLLIPVVIDWHPSYWQSIALYVLGSLVGRSTWADAWSKRGQKP